jgi:hypothetical protein
VSRRIYAIDRNVHVQMVSVVVHDADALVILEPECRASAPFDHLQHFCRRLLPEGQE